MADAHAPFPLPRPGLLVPVAIRVGAISWMPRLLPQIVAVDRLLHSVTSGRLSLLDIAGLPNLMLTVTGRKSGLPRSTPLLCVPDGDRILIAGSYFGGPKEPVWVKNIVVNPDVVAVYQGRTHHLVSRPLTGPDRTAAWQAMLRVWPNFALYEQRTTREIKLFELVLPAAA